MNRCHGYCRNGKRCLKYTVNDFCNIHENVNEQIEQPIEKQTSFIYFFYKGDL